MKPSILYLFYATHFLSVSGYKIQATPTVAIGELAQANFSSEFPADPKFQQDYIIVLAKEDETGKYSQNSLGTTFLRTGNKQKDPKGSVTFFIPQEGKYQVQMYEGDQLFGASDDIVVLNSTSAPSSFGSGGNYSGVDSDRKSSSNQILVILISVLGSVTLICATVIFIFWYRARRFGRQESAGADFSSQASSTVLFKGSKMLRDAPIPPGSTYLSTTVAPSDSISQIGYAPKFIPHLPGYQGRDMGMGAGRKYEESISESELEYPYNHRRSDIEKADGIRDDGLNFPYSIPVITTTAATPSPPSTLVESLRNGRRNRY
ncbi:hypothetical protein VKT23_008145 [Stygiomarasmius scandens]|uniref:Uncharacterized protein n=1 Tax=Marasmiellus scandens TaxID=2682957 RepID=A0ABR1JNJ7_9AGAR